MFEPSNLVEELIKPHRDSRVRFLDEWKEAEKHLMDVVVKIIARATHDLAEGDILVDQFSRALNKVNESSTAMLHEAHEECNTLYTLLRQSDEELGKVMPQWPGLFSEVVYSNFKKHQHHAQHPDEGFLGPLDEDLRQWLGLD